MVTSEQQYRFFESLPGIISWSGIALTLALAYFAPLVFVGCLMVFTLYWVISCFRIVSFAWKGTELVKQTAETDWIARLDAEFPDWQEYYYCALLPYASESINIIRETVQSIVDSNYPNERKILCLSSEKAIPAGREVAEQLEREFRGQFAHIFITEHELMPGEIKGKASNQNHCGRFLYRKIVSLGIEPGKVLLSSNDADVLNDPDYQVYLLYNYLSAGEERDYRIYQPIPTDFNNYWSAHFFSRIIITTGVLWRITLQMRGDYRCTVYSFYSMSLKALHNIGYWDTDLIPEDERTMFKAIIAFGERFRVVPMFILTRGSPVCGNDYLNAFKEQYIQIRRWAWGASEFAHSMSQYIEAPEELKKALKAPIFNQLRTSTEWALSSLMLMFAGYLPALLHPEFLLTPVGQVYPFVLSIVMSLATMLIVGIIVLNAQLAPPKPADRGHAFSAWVLAQWLFAPVIGLALGSIPAIVSQTRLIFNRRIVYIESRKEQRETRETAQRPALQPVHPVESGASAMRA
jgi:hypothetical protein